MGLLNWFFRKPRLKLAAGRGWTVNAVGESNYQTEIETLYISFGGTEHDIKTTAVLVPENNNRHDANAVRVEINKKTVAYLNRAMAVEYRAAVGEAAGECGAKIVGGYSLDDGTDAFRDQAKFVLATSPGKLTFPLDINSY